MNPNLKQIMEKIEKQNEYTLICAAEQQRVEAARFICDQKKWDAETLYIGYANQLEKEKLPETGNFLLLCPEEELTVLRDKLQELQRGNWCLLPEQEMQAEPQKERMHKLMNEVQDILSDAQSFVQSSSALLNSIIQGRGVAYIVEIAGELLGNPVMLGDNNHRLLAYSRCEDVDDNAWNEFRNTGYCTYEYTVKYDFKPLVEKSASSKSPIIGSLGEISRVNRIFATVKIEDKIVGHLAVLEHRRPFKEKDLEVVSFICNLLSAEMQINAQYFNSRNVLLENLFLDLLKDDCSSRERVLERIKYIKWQSPQKMYVMAIQYNSYEDTFSLIPYIRETLTRQFNAEEAVFYEKKLVFILGCRDAVYMNAQDLHALETFLRKNTMKAGISQEFQDIMELKRRFTQAVDAIAIGRKAGKDEEIYFYESYGIYHMIQLAGENRDVEDFCHPAVLKLKKYDQKHKTEYLKTVYAYISNMKNLVATADSLFIHRNTLSYRMTKIYELLGDSLEDDEIVMKFYFSYKILEYTGKL